LPGDGSIADIHDREHYGDALQDAADRVAGGQLPVSLRKISDQHHAKLMSLITTMRAVGVNEDLVRHSVHEIIASYEKELVSATIRLSKECT
jgi:hypothetical protein